MAQTQSLYLITSEQRKLESMTTDTDSETDSSMDMRHDICKKK